MNERDTHYEEQPVYVISVAARMVGMHAQSLRHYERIGLVRPSRSQGRQRLYSQADINRLRSLGLSDRAINDATQVVSFFNYINRIADGLGVDLEQGMPPHDPSLARE